MTRNLVENAILPTAVGKKTGRSSARKKPGDATRPFTRSSRTAGCKGVDPYEYFKDLLTRLPRMTNQDRLDQLTPRHWQQARETSLKPAA